MDDLVIPAVPPSRPPTPRFVVDALTARMTGMERRLDKCETAAAVAHETAAQAEQAANREPPAAPETVAWGALATAVVALVVVLLHVGGVI